MTGLVGDVRPGGELLALSGSIGCSIEPAFSRLGDSNTTCSALADTLASGVSGSAVSGSAVKTWADSEAPGTDSPSGVTCLSEGRLNFGTTDWSTSVYVRHVSILIQKL